MTELKTMVSHCGKCGKRTIHASQRRIAKLPTILVVHLERQDGPLLTRLFKKEQFSCSSISGNIDCGGYLKGLLSDEEQKAVIDEDIWTGSSFSRGNMFFEDILPTKVAELKVEMTKNPKANENVKL